jgi:hypothetical protein
MQSFGKIPGKAAKRETLLKPTFWIPQFLLELAGQATKRRKKILIKMTRPCGVISSLSL